MGIEMQRIAKIESLPREHFCPVCQLLINPNEALQSMCGHLYCRPCLTYVANTTMACPYDGYLVTGTDAKPLVESNKVLADTIGQTVVHCSYKNGGCTWTGSLADSSSHCSGCPFGDSRVMCSWCGINIAHRQWQEHAQVCLGAFYNQASAAMATSQASSQGQGVAATTLTQGQWYQHPYQQYYQNYMQQQQPMQLHSFFPQHQVSYVQVSPSVQTHSERQPQPQLQSPSHQSNQPQTYWTGQIPQLNLSVPPLPQHPSHQTNQLVGAPPNNMFVYHHDHFAESVSHVRSPQSLSASTSDAVHNQMHQEGPSYHPHIALQEHHQPMTPILGVQPHMNHFSATAPQVGLGHAAPSLSAVKEDDMRSFHWPPLGPNKVIHIFGNKDDEAVMEGDEIKSWSLGKQVLEENVGDSWEDLGKSLLAEENGIKDDPSLNGSPLVNPTLLDRDGLDEQLRNSQFDLMIAEKCRARVAEYSLVSPHEKHEPEFELRPVSRSSQPSINLGEGQFRRGPRGLIREHFGMPSHGYGPLDHGLGSRRVETTDSEGRYSFGLQGSEFKGVGNLQMGEKVTAADMIGPVDSNGPRLGDVGSFPGDWSTKHVGSSDCRSQTKEYQQKSMDMVSMINDDEKKHTMAPSDSSQFGNQNKHEESRFKGSEQKEENRSIVHHQ